MGLIKVLWATTREFGGDVLRSRCGKFVIIQSTSHCTLLHHGRAVFRHIREDFVKEKANDLATEELNARSNHAS